MKADEDVRMISAEAPVVFAKACEMFILELTLRSWIHTEENKRRTLQKNDIAGAITRTDIFDFLVDIVPRDELREEGGVVGAVGVGAGAAASALGAVPRPPVGMPGTADLPFGGMYYMPQTAAPTAATMQQPTAAIMAQHQMMVNRHAMGMDPSLKLPRYNGLSCPFIRSSHNCRRQGRTNFDYQKLQWWPIGCTVQRLTPTRLVRQFKNKLVVVLGDSVSKNLADSIKCTLHAATPRSIKTFRLASGKTELAGTWIPRYNIRFVSVFSTHLNNATTLEGQPNAQDIKALWQQPDSTESTGGRGTDTNGTAEGIARSAADRVERIETMANQQSQRIHLDQLDPRVVDLLPVADIVIFQATNWWYSPLNQYYLKNRRVNLTRNAAYALGLTTLRDYVTRSALAATRGLKGFKGKAVLLGASPSHYNIPVPGVKPGFCEVQEMMTMPQTVEFRRSDVKTNVFRDIQRRVLRNSVIRYVDVGPMSDWRPDGHLQNWIVVTSGSTKKNDCLHWCEAGVTDAWLEMVHNTLLF
ncbi:unnamed protein product [Closterium sp. Yama58-4]|nr:unnamed protein product [Closterium sp. Yama58-4]